MQVTRSRRPAQAIYAKKNEEFLFDLLGWSRSDKFLFPTYRQGLLHSVGKYDMDFPEVLRRIAGNPKLLAVLPPGPPGAPAIILTPQMRVMDVRSGKPCKFNGKFSDYVSIQWEIVDMSVPRQPK